jgi:hypothetical protein
MQVDGAGNGWKGWRVELTCLDETVAFSFDEREGVTEPIQAVQKSLESDIAKVMAEAGEITIQITEIRTVISADLSPN